MPDWRRYVIDRFGHEGVVRDLIGKRFGVTLQKRTLVVGKRRDGSDRLHEFDGVSPDGQIVMECKTNQLKTERNPRGRYDSAIKQVIFTDLYMLSRIQAKYKFMVLTDASLFRICSTDMDGLLDPNTELLLLAIPENTPENPC